MWIPVVVLILSVLTPPINSITIYSAGGKENPIKLRGAFNETIPTNTILNSTQIETLCLRMHNNTAFMGTQPYARLIVQSASECRRYCIDVYPNCVAVMFYYLHKRDKKHICYLFNKNSVDEDVALVPEKPMKALDMIRALEVVADCHQFDPFPPLFANFTASTDRVPKKKRDVGFQRPIEATGPWSSWSECSLRTKRQVRSQLCEYGRNIQRRPCSSSSFLRAYGDARMVSPSLEITVSYPPYPYRHPGVSSDEYMRIMNRHSEQVAQSCCYWQNYFQQRAAVAGQVYQPIGTGVCPMPCTYSGVVQLPAAVPVQRPAPTQPALRFVQPPSPVYVQAPLPTYVPPLPPTYVSPLPPTYVSRSTPTYVPPSPPTYVPQSVPPRPPTVIPAQPPTPPQPTPPIRYEPVPRYPEPVYPRYPEPPSTTTPRPPTTLAPPSRPLPVWGEWSVWTQCSATCGVGSMQRYRVCATERCGGEIVERRVCDQIVPCEATWAQWSPWSTCHATCGPAEKTRSRYCLLGEGRCDGSSFEVELCETAPCPEWNQWESWSHCSTSCGPGTRRRMRSCHGDHCLGPLYEDAECEQEACAEWSQWQAWSTCSVSCGQGIIVRERVCLGQHCDGESIEQNSCVQEACPMWHEWGEWSSCSVTCDNGISTRERSCFGSFCPGKRVEVMQCNPGPCAMWSSWQEWSQCSVTCGSGTQRRRRSCIGRDCSGNAEETQHCDTGVSCSQWSSWTAWSKCSRDCGPGEMVRHRDCVAADGSADQSCRGDRTESAICLERPCCEWTPWASWTPCSQKCDGGLSSRTRMCLRSGDYLAEDVSCEGQCYGEDREDDVCNEHIPCPLPTYPPSVPIITTPAPPPTPYPPVPTVPPPPQVPTLPPITPPAPVVPVAPQVPTAGVAPEVPVVPVTPQVPVVPTAPQIPVSPVVPVTPVASQVPVSPVAPITSIAPQVPVSPVAPITSIAPQVPISPVVPVAPAAPPVPVVVPTAQVPYVGGAACLPGVSATTSGVSVPACYTSGGVEVMGLGVGGGAGCHWSAWSGLTSCGLFCGVRQRTRSCLGGGLHCICFGDALEEVDCSSSPACKV